MLQYLTRYEGRLFVSSNPSNQWKTLQNAAKSFGILPAFLSARWNAWRCQQFAFIQNKSIACRRWVAPPGASQLLRPSLMEAKCLSLLQFSMKEKQFLTER